LKILVTGSAGYLGSLLCQFLLQAGHQVRGLDRLMYGGRPLLHLFAQDGFEFVLGDVRDEAVLRAALDGVDAVVHLAAIVGDPACAQDAAAARGVNQAASVALVDAAVKKGVGRFIFASTCSNYGRMADVSRLATEDQDLLPVSLYAETKVAVENHLAAMEGPMAWTVLRFATLYGLSPRMRFDLTVNQFVMEAITSGKLVVFGEQFWRPYVHVRDAARAVACVLESPAATVSHAVFNVGDTAENYRKIDLVKILEDKLGSIEVQYVHRDEDPRDYRVSFDRVRSALGYHVTRRVPDGVVEVAHAVRSGLFGDLTDPVYNNVQTVQNAKP
jgi:nucleoside-diphosphate-sugar epimerase